MKVDVKKMLNPVGIALGTLFSTIGVWIYATIFPTVYDFINKTWVKLAALSLSGLETLFTDDTLGITGLAVFVVGVTAILGTSFVGGYRVARRKRR